MSGAEVAAWDAVGRLAFGRTDGLGIVRIAADRPVTSNAFLLVRRLGFAPVRVEYPDRDSLTITLSTVPTSLPVLALETKALGCATAPWWQVWRRRPSEFSTDAVADSLWRAASSRYAIGVSRLRAERTGTRVEETVTSEQRGYGDGSDLRETASGRYMMIMGESGLRDPPPYALYERHLNISGEFWRWRYASLESISAEHFLSARFHERHSFVVLGTSAGATVIGFCARDYAQAEIEGELQIGPDNVLRSARWFFRVPHDDEDAGGESTFAMIPFEGGLYLLAVRGSSWRRAGRNLYNQVRFEASSWRLSHRTY